jgi:hypothetical protein
MANPLPLSGPPLTEKKEKRREKKTKKQVREAKKLTGWRRSLLT